MDRSPAPPDRDEEAATRRALTEAAARSSARRTRERLLLAALAAVLGGLSVAVNIGPALSGAAPAIGRAVVGALGVVAGTLLWRRPHLGWPVALVWALVQVPVYAWTPDGSPTLRVLSLPLEATSRVEVNGRLTSYSEVGINLVGVALVAWLLSRRDALTRPA